jgi:membrane-associated phospholipid phosphatase
MEKSVKLSVLFCIIFTQLGIAQVRDSTARRPAPIVAVGDSLSAQEYKPKAKSFILPAVFIGYGLVSLTGDNVIRKLDFTTKNELQEDHGRFANQVDNFLQYLPGVAVYGLNLAGIKGKHNLLDATGIYVMTGVIAGISVESVKKIANRQRPDASNNYSFPSGHTATAFASAEFLKQEYKDVSPLYGVAGYAIATGTGILRLYNNKHWVSDVVAGAGFGIASTKLAYFLYPKVKSLLTGKGNLNYSVVPSYRNRVFGFNLNGSF